MTKDEALKLALEALELNNDEWKSLADSGDCGYWNAEDQDHYKQTNEAITAIKQALAAPVQDSTCNETLRAQGKAYPRTCRKCGLGPCIGAPKQPPAAQRPDVDALVALARADEREAFNKERQQYADWLDEAAADIEDWGMYASEYLQQKWDLPDQVQDYKNRAAAIRARGNT